jgi:hypothetical protein
VKLADGKERTIQHMMATTFWHPDGTPMSAQQFMEMLFGRLPEFFKNETELRGLWSAPDTRAKLLQGLAERGFGQPSDKNLPTPDNLCHPLFPQPAAPQHLKTPQRAFPPTSESGTGN